MCAAERFLLTILLSPYNIPVRCVEIFIAFFFKDGETEAKGGYITCPRSPNYNQSPQFWVQSPGLSWQPVQTSPSLLQPEEIWVMPLLVILVSVKGALWGHPGDCWWERVL